MFFFFLILVNVKLLVGLFEMLDICLVMEVFIFINYFIINLLGN